MTEMMTTFIVFFSLTQRKDKVLLIEKSIGHSTHKSSSSIFDIFEQKQILICVYYESHVIQK